jgi:uncharacterized protein (TIGR03435 family)
MNGRWGVAAAVVCLAARAFAAPSQAGPEFEVASIKLAVGVPGSGSGSHKTPTSITYYRQSLQNLIINAYKVKPYQLVAPGWLAGQLFDVSATYPAGTPKPQIDLMVQTLLAQRFKLAIHREQKEMAVYALVVGKNGPKLKEGKPGSGGMIRLGAGMLVAPSTTVALFASNLTYQADRPIIDMTGLMGTYDFDFRWTPDAPAGALADPSGPTLLTAIQEQLGLRLDARKMPIEVLIVDHAEKLPAEN